jgi:hypothetical protein
MNVVRVSNKHDNDNGRSWIGENWNNTVVVGDSDLRAGQFGATYSTNPTQPTRICGSDDFRSDLQLPPEIEQRIRDVLSTDDWLLPPLAFWIYLIHEERQATQE